MNVLAGCASVAAVRTLALSVGGPARASSSSEEGASEAEFEQQVAVDPNNGAQRSAVPIEGEGLKLNTQPDDRIRIEGGTVTWLDSAGGRGCAIWGGRSRHSDCWGRYGSRLRGCWWCACYRRFLLGRSEA